MDSLSERIAALSPESRKLLLALLSQAPAEQSTPDARPDSKSQTAFPLSYPQRRLWFLDQLQPGSAAYNMRFVWRLNGLLNVAALQHGLNEVVRRHTILRTRVATLAEEAVQVVQPAAPVPMPLVDLQSRPPGERDAALQHVLTAEAEQPFDLTGGPLLRVKLVRLTAREHVLLLVLHHMVADGWSTGVLLRELGELYTAFLEGRASALPALPVQYADFAIWQREWLSGERLTKQLDYWRQQLHGAPPALDLPTDRPRPPIQTFHGATQRFDLAPSLTLGLNTLSRQAGATLFMTLLAALQTLLYRYTGQTDVSVGAPIANRTGEHFEGLIGFFANTLVLRGDLSGNPTFREFLQRVCETCWDAFTHRELPFEKLVEELQPERDLSRTPLFQVMFILQNTPRETLALPALTLSPLVLHKHTARFDLTLSLTEADGRLSGQWEYNTDLFEAERIARLAEHFQTLLQQVVAVPTRPVGTIPILSEAERRQLLAGENATQAEYPREAGVHTLIESQAACRPEATAVTFEDESLSYAALNARANQAAHALRRLGVRPGALVGLCVERSLDMLVGVLGALKAGAAYVPLDPAYPKERLAFILADADVVALLTQRHLIDDLPEHTTHVVCLDEDLNGASTDLNLTSPADSLAYVIYTSGSTGRPKGVQIPHRALVNFLTSMRRQPGLSEGDVLLAVTTLSFDIAGLELFLPLTTGARIELVSRDVATDGARLAGHLACCGATVMQATPSTWRMLIESDWAGRPGLKILCGGEACPRELADALLARGASVWNLYGPTETTVWSAAGRVEAGAAAPSLGGPIANTQLYVLDEHLNPVPAGVMGEVYIGGDGLAWGYLHRPELTAERFIPDPFAPPLFTGGARGGRLYRTGDRARRVWGGGIEFLGRVDFQVKVRGHRIELGEIETALRQHPAVQESVVVAQTWGSEQRLVAYVVPAQASTASDWRAFLKTRLPEYMLPAVFVSLAALPLTPNGKVDRRALPALENGRPELAKALVAPRTPIEKTLAGIWSEVLRLQAVGVHDNFFELGGHSLLTLQVINKASRAGLHFTPRHFFQHPTIAELAALEGDTPDQAEQGLVVGPVPLLSVPVWFFNQNFKEPHRWNLAKLLEVRLPLDPRLMDQAVQHLHRHHDVLRSRFTQTATGWRHELAPPGDTAPFSVIDFAELPPAELPGAIEAAADAVQGSLNLAGPLCRVVYFYLGARRPGRVLIVAHHLLLEGVYSLPLLLEDLQSAYRQLGENGRVRLPAKTTSVQRWAEQLSAYARSDTLRQELEAYWLKLPWGQVAPIPLDYPDGMRHHTVSSERFVEAALSVDETKMLLGPVLKHYQVEVTDVWVTALAQALQTWAGGRWVKVLALNAGRNILPEVDVSRSVGCFPVCSVFLLEWEQRGSIGQALQAIRDQLRRIPHQGLGYELLRYGSGDAEVVKQLAPLHRNDASVRLNYLGRRTRDAAREASSLLRPAPEPYGTTFHPGNRRDLLLQCVLSVECDQLAAVWQYGESVHTRETVERVAGQFMTTLRRLIAECPAQ